MLCNISQNAMGQPPGGVPCQVQPGGGVPCWGVPLWRGTLAGGYPTGGYPGQVPPWPGQDGVVPCQGGTQVRYPPSQVRMRGGTQLGQHREYLLHGGRYASCVHAGGLSCYGVILNLLDRKMHGSMELRYLPNRHISFKNYQILQQFSYQL